MSLGTETISGLPYGQWVYPENVEKILVVDSNNAHQTISNQSNHIHYFLGVLKHTCPPQIYANYVLTLSCIEGNWTNKDQRTMLQIFAFAFAHSDRGHICPVNRVPIVSRYDLSPIWRQGIIWANAVLSSTPKEICFVEIWIYEWKYNKLLWEICIQKLVCKASAVLSRH